jgi:hypothetical protein
MGRRVPGNSNALCLRPAKNSYRMIRVVIARARKARARRILFFINRF